MKHQRKTAFVLSLVCLLLAFASLSVPAAQAEGSSKHRGTWLWDTPLIKTSSDEILDFSRQNGVNVIYLQMNKDVRPEFYKSFISKASSAGIEIHVLGGSPKWALASERYRLEDFISWTRDYQASALPEERFTGIHIDVEPHTLPDWNTNQAALITQWADSVQYLGEQARALNLPITADIPFWLYKHQLPDGSMSMSRWMMTNMDAVVIMAYRDSAANIYNLASVEMEEADELGKKSIIAVETKSSKEGAFITFYEEGTAYMEQQLSTADKLASRHNSYDGIAVHEYKAWKELQERGM